MHTYPFSAIVGQEKMKLALILNAIQPAIGGVLIRGEKGTAKSTAVRSLAAVLPELAIVSDCPFSCPPDQPATMCASCRTRLEQGETLPVVDLLLDAAAMGVNIVEREGVSFSHPARFMLVGTMNPEEGELRPQLTDRFGLCVDITSIHNIQQRIEIVELRERFEAEPQAFLADYATAEQELRSRIIRAAQLEQRVTVLRPVAELIALINIELDVDGHRGDIVMRRAAQTYAAYLGEEEVTPEHVYTIAPMALAHRLKRLPLQQTSRTIDDALKSIKKKLARPEMTKKEEHPTNRGQ